MQIVFDRYAPREGARHVDLATGRLVMIAIRDVPDADWRRRWRVRVDALLAGCESLELLADAGEAGPHAVFEVREVMQLLRAGRGPVARARAAEAIGWLHARGLSPGPCRQTRLVADGRLCADGQTGWPIETPAEKTASRAMWRAWRRLLRHLVIEPSRRSQPLRHGGGSLSCADEGESRAGLVALGGTVPEALRFARATGRLAIAGAIPPQDVPGALRARRSFVIVESTRDSAAAWATALATCGSQRHYFVPRAASPKGLRHPPRAVVREPAIAYTPSIARPVETRPPESPRARAVLSRAQTSAARRRLADVQRSAGRAALLAGAASAVRADALLLKAQALRWNGRPRDAAALLESELRENPAASSAPFLTEAAEAACDNALLQQAEAFARAALLAAADAAAETRARLALDRARVWRMESVETRFWLARARWHTWAIAPAWPSRGMYPHAPCGRLATWESLCDRLERAIWNGSTTEASRLGKRFALVREKLPALLRARSDWLISGDSTCARRMGLGGVLQTGKAGAVMEIFEHMSALLRTCHESASDERALAEAAARTRQVLRAASVAVYACGKPLPVAGDGMSWNVPSALATRCMESVQSIGPGQPDAAGCAATSIRGSDGPLGALLATWPSGGQVETRRVRLLLEAAALVIAPVLRGWSLRADAPAVTDMPDIVGVSPAIATVRDAIRRVAQVPFAVLIEGESGVGKELVARAIHRLSSRASRPFRAINCAAMAEELVEAELFGHSQGAYTGAVTARAGLFEDADRGTLFLDEVSELSPRAQAKLLRVLQEREVRRVGETTPRRIDVRILAASNRPLAAAAAGGAFRSDLLFRLDVLRIVVPPLRARPEDIPLLCAHVWRDAAQRTGSSALLSTEAVGKLAAYGWPGNVRELQNVIVAIAVSSARRGRVGVEHLPPHIRCDVGPRPTLHQAKATLERDLVQSALARAGGKPGRAAAELGLSRQGFAKLMRRLGLPAA